MTTTASPASFATISPAPDDQQTPISIDQLLHLLGQIRVPQEEPASPTASPSSSHLPAVATSTDQPNMTLSISLSSVPPLAPPLDPTIANRVIVLTHKQAARAEHALIEPHPACCDQSRLSQEKIHNTTTTKHLTNKRPIPNRNRALSAPVNGVILPSSAVLPVDEAVHKESPAPSQKQTKREWLADLDRVSNILSAMFEDGDRCARYA